MANEATPLSLLQLYCKVMRGIRQFQDDTLKIRPTDILKEDATFLSVKRFKKVNGMKIVEACITLVNDNDEKRSQSFTPTEVKDVIIDSVKNMVASQNEMGQNGARIIYVDNTRVSPFGILKPYQVLESFKNT